MEDLAAILCVVVLIVLYFIQSSLERRKRRECDLLGWRRRVPLPHVRITVTMLGVEWQGSRIDIFRFPALVKCQKPIVLFALWRMVLLQVIVVIDFYRVRRLKVLVSVLRLRVVSSAVFLDVHEAVLA